MAGLGLDFVHDHGYNLEQIKAGDFDKSKTLYVVLLTVVMFGLQILKRKKN